MLGGPLNPPPGSVSSSTALEQRGEGAHGTSGGTKSNRLSSSASTIAHHLKHHFGVGLVCAVAYFDPGNWSTDLLAGSEFGYKLLFVVLLAGLGAVVLQILSCKLGCVTGLDLASHCRLLMYNHPRYPRLVRFLFLYPLYVLSEIAIISTDIAELLGSAIGIVLIIPAIPLPVAVFLTAADCLVILFVGDPTKGQRRALRIFELIIIALVLVVFVCFIVLLAKVSPNWSEVFEGYLPSKTLVESSALLSSVGIIGATVMPHALFLGSHLATRDRISDDLTRIDSSSSTLPGIPARPLDWIANFRKGFNTLFRPRRVRQTQEEEERDTWTPYGERSNNTLSFIRAHFKHGVWDIVISLMGVAVVINSAILILAGSVFFFGSGKTMDGSSAGLFDAYDVLKSVVGSPAAVVFALALICSGQSASITATLAGQIVSEGFIQWTVSPFLRRLITRLLGLVPAVVVAAALGKKGIDALLVISQVVLSIVLPFVMFPLIWLTSSTLVMRVEIPREGKAKRKANVRDAKGKGTVINMAEVSDSSSISGEKPSCKAVVMNEHFEGMLYGEEEDESGDIKSSSSSSSKVIDPEKSAEGSAAEETHAEEIEADDEEPEYINYANGWPLTIISYGVWLVILAANGYLIVTLAIAD